MMVLNIVVMCAKYSVDIFASTSTNITAAASHATSAVITHVAVTTTTNNNNKNVGQIYNCNRVIVTLTAFDHMNLLYKLTRGLSN
jgi:hypothetical protein